MARRPGFALGEGEVVLADVSAPLSTLIFPLLELIVITGIAWIAIGWMDVTPGVEPFVRNAVVLVWLLLALWRFGVPVVRSRRRRFLVTDHRILARGRSGGVDSIPHRQIHSVGREHGGITVAIYGYERPIHFEQVGKTRAVERVIGEQLAYRR
ncbi:hypothetical protein JZY91_02035 [Corynebacterium sp. CNCTC7651]|uniref:hypothetical protein n=1 Tax=Corynebacterium sp. CNCTC7651 TaxID=2815361 RepID=UPI001F252183|nr:hypothetical protein [Corynebacterium sp. CNCTC7651]UIZ92604.1 hypothetical protein JZY91_02035 [Corynebacterium sp. CNCTC7651]